MSNTFNESNIKLKCCAQGQNMNSNGLALDEFNKLVKGKIVVRFEFNGIVIEYTICYNFLLCLLVIIF